MKRSDVSQIIIKVEKGITIYKMSLFINIDTIDNNNQTNFFIQLFLQTEKKKN